MRKFIVTAHTVADGRALLVKGRDAWALLELVKARANGCTPIDNPGPRWSGYVFNLKHTHGLDIETRHEPYRGLFPGTHARYVLLSAVEIISRSEEPERAAA